MFNFKDNNMKKMFELAIGLEAPWQIDNIELTPATESSSNKKNNIFGLNEQFELHIFVSYNHKETGEKVHDRKTREWRHLDFFQHKAFIHADVPRIIQSDNSVKQAKVPWAREGSGFTLLFEILILELVKNMPVAAVARYAREHDTRLWRIIKAYVDKARESEDFSSIKAIGIDETSSKKGHNYISVFADMGSKKVIFCCEGKDSSVVSSFKQDFEKHNGDIKNIEYISMDMSKAFICGAQKELPDTEIVFDEFHVIKAMNDAVNKVRQQEVKVNEDLKNTRYWWLKNPDNLSDIEREKMDAINPLKCNWKTARAYRYKLGLQACFQADPDEAEGMLKKWYAGACRTSLKLVKKVAKMVKNHFDGIVAAIKTGITNGTLEAVNGLIRAAKVKARGYRNVNTLCCMVYLLQGRLNFSHCFMEGA